VWISFIPIYRKAKFMHLAVVLSNQLIVEDSKYLFLLIIKVKKMITA